MAGSPPTSGRITGLLTLPLRPTAARGSRHRRTASLRGGISERAERPHAPDRSGLSRARAQPRTAASSRGESKEAFRLVDIGTGEGRIASTALAHSPNRLASVRTAGRLRQRAATVGEFGTRRPWRSARHCWHSRDVQQPVFSLDGRTLYTVSSDGAAIAWDVTGTRRVMRPFRFTHDRDFDRSYDAHLGRFSARRPADRGRAQEGGHAPDAKALTQTGAPSSRPGRGLVRSTSLPTVGSWRPSRRTGAATIWDLTRARRAGSHSPSAAAFLSASSSRPTGGRPDERQ